MFQLWIAKVQASEDFTATTDVSGLSKAQSEIKNKAFEPTRPFNNSSSGRIILSTVDFLSEDSDPLNTEIVALVVEEDDIGLPKGGDFDGLYEMSTSIFDLAGNQASSSQLFFSTLELRVFQFLVLAI